MNSAHLSAIVAFTLWGFFPIYWKALDEVPAWDLFGHRLLWSFITLALILAFRKKFHVVTNIWKNPKQRYLLMLSAFLISSNWLLYIYAINTNRILEASMSYFLNPLFNVVMGSLILKEKLRRGQWPAIILACVAIIVMAVQADINQIPWIALLLSITFALYSLIRKMVHVGSLEGLCFETSVMILPLLLAWNFQPTSPASVFSVLPGWKIALLALSGLVTSTPLVLFAYGAKRLPFSTLGFIQYLSPSFKFLCGLLIFNEALSHERLQAFMLIWIALAWYSVESYLYLQKIKKLAEIR